MRRLFFSLQPNFTPRRGVTGDGFGFIKMNNFTKPLKPYLKWAGGKRQLLPEIRKYLPEKRGGYTYYEPFTGAGAVFFDLRPERAVINDCNTQLMMTYRVIKENVEELINLLNFHREQNGRDYYYEIRNLDRDTLQFNALSDTEKAARLIFLNKTCYNGLYRVNSRGLFNVPYGRYINPVIFEEWNLREIGGYLNAYDVSITSLDFEDALTGAGKEAFVYFDPPYHQTGKAAFTAYQAKRFGEDEQRRLRDVFVKAVGRGARCLLSNADSAFIRELYRDFEIIPVGARRAINSRAAGRGLVGEVLVKT